MCDEEQISSGMRSWAREACVVASAGDFATAAGPDKPDKNDKNAPFRIEEATIADIQKAILSRQVTTTDIVKLYLTRIKAYNGTCVNQPEGLLGPISTIAHAGQLNAFSTLNLRPATRKAWGFDDHHARSMTDLVDDARPCRTRSRRPPSRTRNSRGPASSSVRCRASWSRSRISTTRSTCARRAAPISRTPTIVRRTIRRSWRASGRRARSFWPRPIVGGFQSRSAFGGTVCNAYDTERTPRGSSSGSAVGVAANLVTCAIGEETGTSIRIPSSSSNVVGLSPTVELVSRTGMIGEGLTTRTGPICRTVGDAARMLAAVVGYDATDPLTAFSIGRTPAQPYQSFAGGTRLDGIRIGVVREFMDKRLFTKRDEAAIDIVDQAIADLHRTGATIVDPGAGGALFTACFQKYVPQAFGKLFTTQHPDLFPVDADGKPTADHIATLVEMAVQSGARAGRAEHPRDRRRAQARGDNAYWRALYLHDRNDALLKTARDVSAATKPIKDPVFAASSGNISTKAPYGSGAGRGGRQWRRRRPGAGHGGPHAAALCVPAGGLVVHGGSQSGCAGLPDQQHSAQEDSGAGRAGGERPEPGPLGRLRPERFPGDHRSGRFHQQIYDRVPDPASR